MRAKLPLSLENRNAFTVMLMQATWGSISSNFRTVAASFGSSTWEILFVLETESPQDREEIQDIVDEFDGLICGYAPSNVRLVTTILVSAEPLPVLDLSKWQPVFRRHEI